MEKKTPAPRKRVVKKPAAPAVEKRLVWKWLPDTQELVQIEVDE